MAYQIQGTSNQYQFPDTFDLTSYNREVEVPTAQVYGRDGSRRVVRKQRQQQTVHVISGILQKSSVSAALDELGKLEDACNNVDANYLVDTANNRRVKVWLQSLSIPRNPARMLAVSATFITSDVPYWEDTSLTSVTTATAKWSNLSIGDAPVKPEMIVCGTISNPSLVLGNYNFVSHMTNTQASAINSRVTGNIWGTVIGNIGSASAPEPSKYGFGRYLDGATLTFSSLACQSQRFSAIIRYEVRTSWATSNDFYLFDFNDGASGLATHHLYLKLRNSNAQTILYEFGHGGTNGTLGGEGSRTSFTSGEAVEVGVWYNPSASTVRAKIYEGQTLVASSATITSAAGTLSKLWVGSDRDNANPARQLIDEVYIYHQAMGDSYLKGEMLAQKRLTPDNKTFKWASTLDAGDFLEVQHRQTNIRKWDISAVTYNPALRDFTGDFFELGRNGNHANVETVYSSQAMTVKWEYRKRYY